MGVGSAASVGVGVSEGVGSSVGVGVGVGLSSSLSRALAAFKRPLFQYRPVPAIGSAVDSSTSLIRVLLYSGCAAFINAATPATYGADILVPLIYTYEFPRPVDKILSPGAVKSTHLP